MASRPSIILKSSLYGCFIVKTCREKGQVFYSKCLKQKSTRNSTVKKILSKKKDFEKMNPSSTFRTASSRAFFTAFPSHLSTLTGVLSSKSSSCTTKSVQKTINSRESTPERHLKHKEPQNIRTANQAINQRTGYIKKRNTLRLPIKQSIKGLAIQIVE